METEFSASRHASDGPSGYLISWSESRSLSVLMVSKSLRCLCHLFQMLVRVLPHLLAVLETFISGKSVWVAFHWNRGGWQVEPWRHVHAISLFLIIQSLLSLSQ